ncbi:MAG TPA: Kdo hydroxylase family protein [Candidatus Sulfotelmatobacter sp.]|nr:Kdo hydroxylase family protein [Candidatus Sulfotelmatobacter sp.]
MTPILNSAIVDVTNFDLAQARWHCDQLERGKVLFFGHVPFDFPDRDREFLLSQKQTGSRFHKNISYRPAKDLLKGVDDHSPDRERMVTIMRTFSRSVTAFIAQFLAPYTSRMKLDFASFRPLEEQGRDLPLHKRNDLMHVDAFPSRPTHGARILRVFANINPSVGRVWNVGEPFHEFLPRLMQVKRIGPSTGGLGRALARIASKIGLPVAARSPYDEFMLYLHDWLKENNDFQKNSPKQELIFPPGSAWMVYTDGVPHAAMSGQYALEQTFIIPREALVTPQVAPCHVLEDGNYVPRTRAAS